MLPKVNYLLISIIIALGSCLPVHAEVLEIKLQKNMSYSEAKKILVKAGWQHADLPAYGYSKKDQKVISECFGQVRLCNDYPELLSCSGQGYCRMSFYDHFGNKLQVVTYGNLGDKGVSVLRWWLGKD
jgi:hypothetical protein